MSDKENIMSKCSSWLLVCLKKHGLKVIGIGIVIGIIYLIFPKGYNFITELLNIDKNDPGFRWEYTKSIGYLLGVALLIWQITISSRRAKAAEDNAKAALNANIEQRYHNAVEHLDSKKTTKRIGAIYNLYHISQLTDTYDKTIFDMFIQFLQSSPVDSKKEKQIIIDKLFKEKEEKRVLKNPKNINLEGIYFEGIDFTNAYLKGANLKSTGSNFVDPLAPLVPSYSSEASDVLDLLDNLNNLDSCVFDNAILTGAKLPTNLTKLKSMNGANLDETEFFSESDLSGLQLKGGSWKNAKVRYTDLQNADLTGTDLTGTDFTGTNLTDVIGLTYKQLRKVKCLYNVQGLDTIIQKKLQNDYPKLFKPLEDNKDD